MGKPIFSDLFRVHVNGTFTRIAFADSLDPEVFHSVFVIPTQDAAELGELLTKLTGEIKTRANLSVVKNED